MGPGPASFNRSRYRSTRWMKGIPSAISWSRARGATPAIALNHRWPGGPGTVGGRRGVQPSTGTSMIPLCGGPPAGQRRDLRLEPPGRLPQLPSGGASGACVRRGGWSIRASWAWSRQEPGFPTSKVVKPRTLGLLPPDPTGFGHPRGGQVASFAYSRHGNQGCPPPPTVVRPAKRFRDGPRPVFLRR